MLFLSDLDFTLLRSDTSLSDFTKEVWNKANKKAKLSIATARSYTGVKELLKGLELKEPLILLDGTIIAKPTGEILHMAALESELANTIIYGVKKELAVEPLIVAYKDNSEHFYYPKKLNKYQKELIKSMELRKRIFCEGEIRAKKKNLKIVYQANEQITKALLSYLKKNFSDAIEVKSALDPYYNCYFTTILHKEGDKAHALKKLEAIENVSIAQTTVFGDSHNDLGLFSVAGVKIAVANAIDELKEKADIILPWSNDEDAVAKYLQKKLLFGV